jgi:hypothetical protein
MSYRVNTIEHFEKTFKKLYKKHLFLKTDLAKLITKLEADPTKVGTPLGDNCYKIRMAIASKGKGKSGGARVISYVLVDKKQVYLLSIYDKSAETTISEADLAKLIMAVIK